jgi:hypothetical protein
LLQHWIYRTLEIARVAEPGGSEYILTVTDQNLVHCLLYRQAEDPKAPRVVRLDEASRSALLRLAAFVSRSQEDGAGEFADRAG